ncbi:MAG: tetratricopeptide repeat protein [Acidobacteria bacterium]|nr:tetratricopeptide repeat protein [Acidobacteriota bacterium]
MPQAPDPSRIDRLACRILAALVFLLPLVHSGTLSDPFSSPKRILVVTAAILLAGLAILSRLYEDDASWTASPSLWTALIFLACAALSILSALNRGLALWGALDLAAGVAIFWGVARFVRDPPGAALLLRAVLAGAACVSIGTVLQVFYPGLSLAPGGFSLLPPTRGGATLGDAGLAAQFLLPALPAGVGAAALSAGRWRAVCGGLLGLVVAALLFAGRPEAWIVGGGVAFLLVASRILQVALRDGRWQDLAPGLGGHSLLAFMSAVIVSLLIVAVSRFPALFPSGRPTAALAGVSLLTPTTGDPAVDRAASVPGTLTLIARHPLGVGPDNWRHAFLEVAWSGEGDSTFTLSHQAVHAGNAFLEMAAETGVAGGAAFALLLLLLLLQSGLAAVRAPAPWGIAGLAAFNIIGATCMIAFLGAPFQEPTPACLLWVTAGLVQAALLNAEGVRRPLDRLVPRLRMPLPRPLRSRRASLAAAAVWLLASAGLGFLVTDRVRAARLILAGQGAFFAGQYQPALLAFGQPVVRRSPDYLPRVLAANAYLRLGFHDLAAQEFKEALERSPYFIAAYLGRAAARQAQGRYDLAEQDLRRGLALWPRNPDIQLAYGRLDMARGRLDDALERLLETVRISRASAEPYFLMGEIYARRGQIDEALEAYRICGMKNPRHPGLHLRLGDAFYKKGLHENALRYYQAAAQSDEKAVEPRLKIASTHHALGEYCGSMQALEAARDLEADASRREMILDLIARVEPDCRKERKKQEQGG